MQSTGPKLSTTPLRQWGFRQWGFRQWGFRQCLPFSWTTLRDKHCRHPIAVMGVVDMFRQRVVCLPALSPICFDFSVHNRHLCAPRMTFRLDRMCLSSLSYPASHTCIDSYFATLFVTCSAYLSADLIHS